VEDGSALRHPSGPRHRTTRADASPSARPAPPDAAGHFPDPRDEPGPQPGRPRDNGPSPARVGDGARALRRFEPIRFTEVIAELRAIAGVAEGSDPALPDGKAVASACRRAELLLHRLEAQFLSDVVTVSGSPAS
jgi:hypothetical protein